MSGATLVTIGLLGTADITASGTYDISLAGLGTANIEGGGAAAPIVVDVAALAGVVALYTTDISSGATEVLNAAASVSLIDNFNIGETAAGAITGNGTLDLGAGLVGVTVAQSIDFFGTDNKLVLDPGLNLGLLNSIGNFGAGDTIELKGITNAAQAVFTPASGLLGSSGGTVTLEDQNGAAVGSFALVNGTYATNAFGIVADPNGGVDVAETGSIMAQPFTLAAGVSTVLGATPEYVIASGQDTIYTGAGSDTIGILAGSDTVDASLGSSFTQVGVKSGYAGSVDFIGGTGPAFVDGGAGTVTFQGGAGTATVFGGTGGNNSIVGGSGAIFAVGGGDNSTVIANSAQTNYLFAGVGTETLIATASTGNNLFDVNQGAGGDVFMSEGSGTQYFFASGGTSTMTGSTVAGANNVFFGGTEHGGAAVITNFSSISGQIDAAPGTSIAAVTSVVYNGVAGSAVTLSDGTQMTLLGVQQSSLHYVIGGTSVT